MQYGFKKFILSVLMIINFGFLNSKNYQIPLKIKNIMDNYQIEEQFFNSISRYSTFNEELFLDYYLFSKTLSEPLNYIYILNYVNYPNFLSFDDLNYPALTDPIIFVNPKFYLNENFIPKGLIEINNFSFVKRNTNPLWMESLVNDYQLLCDFLLLHNYELTIFSAYRSFSYQENLYNPSNPYTAKPGHSEHQTGFAIDISTLTIGLTIHFKNSPIYSLLKDNAHLFGFVLRYPIDKEDITGYPFEPWHYRYVSKDIANIMYNENLCLEEYFYQYVLLDY